MSTYNELKLSVVMPAKNEGLSIASVVKNVLKVVPQAEVIVVDDGSTDETAFLANDAGARVISHPYSMGNGAAIKTGARNAKGDIIVFMDADGQHNPDDIPRLLEGIANGYDLVVGARSSKSQASIARLVANGFYNRFASWMVGHQIDDLTSGFRAVVREKFIQFLYLLPNGFSYPTTSTMAFFRAGHSVAYVPIVAEKRIGKSHISISKDGVRFLLIIFKIGTLYSPLKLFAPISVMFLFLGIGYYSYTYFFFDRFTNMSALLMISSLLFFVLGLISEQVSMLQYMNNEKKG
ncbi:MAG: glycosyltransferase family 2 protein [Pseudomonadales bacterium]|nr:glycosyltransferase family 2 protein [Pseudomonadales bacterium]